MVKKLAAYGVTEKDIAEGIISQVKKEAKDLGSKNNALSPCDSIDYPSSLDFPITADIDGGGDSQVFNTNYSRSRILAYLFNKTKRKHQVKGKWDLKLLTLIEQMTATSYSSS